MTDRGAGRSEDEALDATLDDERPLGLEEGKQWRIEPSDGARRFSITTWLLGITVILGVGALAMALFAPTAVWDRSEQVVTLVLVPFQTLLGTAVGWYFRGRRD